MRNIISDTLREQIQSLLPDDELRVLITDATAVPIEIRFPQDTSLLNQARLNLEEMLLDTGSSVANQASTNLQT